MGAAIGGALVGRVGTGSLLAAGGLGVLAVGWQFNQRRQRVLPQAAAAR